MTRFISVDLEISRREHALLTRAQVTKFRSQMPVRFDSQISLNLVLVQSANTSCSPFHNFIVVR